MTHADLIHVMLCTAMNPVDLQVNWWK